MGKFHINDSGEPKRCIAGPGRCRYRQEDGSEVEHYPTKEAAREAYERSQEDAALPSAGTVTESDEPNSGPSGVVDLADLIGKEKTRERLERIREHMTDEIMAELRAAPRGTQSYYYMALVDQHERGELTEGQFVNMATAKAGGIVAGASSTVQSVVEREIFERHMATMREEYSAAIADVGDQMEPGRRKPSELEYVFERNFAQSYGAGAKSPEERAEALAVARRELEIFGPIADQS